MAKAKENGVLAVTDGMGTPSENPNTLVVFYNPAPHLTQLELDQAEAEGSPVKHHRGNTSWFLIVPVMNVTLELKNEAGTPLTGYQNWERLVRSADRIVTQLRAMEPEQLQKYQTELPFFAEWDSIPPGSLYTPKLIPATL